MIALYMIRYGYIDFNCLFTVRMWEIALEKLYEL